MFRTFLVNQINIYFASYINWPQNLVTQSNWKSAQFQFQIQDWPKIEIELRKKKTYPPFSETLDGGILSAGNIERIRRRRLFVFIGTASSAGLNVVVVGVPAVRRALKETHVTVAGEMAPSDFSLHSLFTTHTSHSSLHYHWFTITMRNRIFKQTVKHTLSQIWKIYLFYPVFHSLSLHFLTRQTEIRVPKKKKKEKKEKEGPGAAPFL